MSVARALTREIEPGILPLVWWIPTPHLGGKPYTYFTLTLRIDSRNCLVANKPRTPCLKLAMRFQRPGLVREFMRSGRTPCLRSPSSSRVDEHSP
jgi:hypothetical protein